MTAYDVILAKMEKEIKRSLDEEISTELFRNILKEECKELNLILYPAFSSRTDHAILAYKFGMIEDIDLENLSKFKNSIQRTLYCYGQEVHGIITKFPKQFLSKNDVIGYVSSDEDFELVGKKLNNAFIVNPSKKYKKNDFKVFRKLVVNSIINDEKERFEISLDVYFKGFEYYTNYIEKSDLKFSSDDLKSPFVQWTFFTIVAIDFEEFVKITSKSLNTKLIAIFAFKLMQLFNNTIDYTIKFNDNSIFNLIMAIFPSIYRFSYKSENIVGKDRSIRYPRSMILNIINIFENNELGDEESKNLKILLYKIVDVFFIIFKDTIMYVDYDFFKEIHTSLSTLTNSLRHNDMNVEFKKELLIQWFEASSFIIKKIDLGEFEREKYIKFLDILLNEFPDYQTLVTVVENIGQIEMNQMEICLADLDNLWEEYPIYEAEIIDTMGRILLLYCLRGIELTETSEEYPSLDSSSVIRMNFDRIINICETIKEEQYKWYWLIGSDIDEKVDKFLNISRKAINGVNTE